MRRITALFGYLLLSATLPLPGVLLRKVDLQQVRELAATVKERSGR